MQYGREIVKKPACPFCGMRIDKPGEPDTRMPLEMPVGSCACGAVYVCDETGHSLGAAMMEALTYACDMDPDLAAGLLPEDDYREEIVERYDYMHHIIVPGGALEGRRIRGALFFIRLHDDVQEVTAEGVKARMAHTAPAEAPQSQPTRPYSKQEVEDFVRRYDIEPILNAAGHDKKLIRNLQRLLYSGDDLFRKRAAETLGRVSAVIAQRDPRTVSQLLQRLFTAINDTAAFTWGAFEAVGEIIGRRPDLFGGYIPHLYPFLMDDARRAQALETLGAIARARPDLLRKITFRILLLLTHPSPAVCGHAVRLLGFLGAHEARENLGKLRGDTRELECYEAGTLTRVTIDRLVVDALDTNH